MILEEMFEMQEISEFRLNLTIGETLFLEVRERIYFDVGIKLYGLPPSASILHIDCRYLPRGVS